MRHRETRQYHERRAAGCVGRVDEPLVAAVPHCLARREDAAQRGAVARGRGREEDRVAAGRDRARVPQATVRHLDDVRGRTMMMIRRAIFGGFGGVRSRWVRGGGVGAHRGRGFLLRFWHGHVVCG